MTEQAKKTARKNYGHLFSQNIERCVDELYTAAKNMLDNAEARGKAEGLAEGKASGIVEGKMLSYFDLILRGLLKIEDAASILSMSISTFKDRLSKYAASQGVALPA